MDTDFRAGNTKVLHPLRDRRPHSRRDHLFLAERWLTTPTATPIITEVIDVVDETHGPRHCLAPPYGCVHPRQTPRNNAVQDHDTLDFGTTATFGPPPPHTYHDSPGLSTSNWLHAKTPIEHRNSLTRHFGAWNIDVASVLLRFFNEKSYRTSGDIRRLVHDMQEDTDVRFQTLPTRTYTTTTGTRSR